MQFKFVPLKSVLNYIPDSIKEEESKTNLLSWAFQGYRENVYGHAKYAYKACVGYTDAQNKFQLPGGVMKIAFVGLSNSEVNFPGNGYTVTQFHNKADGEDYRAIIQQELLVSTGFLDQFLPLKYLGQNPDLLTKRCCNLYTRTCDTGFSIARDMSYIAVDKDNVALCVIYKTLIQDDDGSFLIPESSKLLRAMGLFAQAQHWINRQSRGESLADKLYNQRMAEAGLWFTKAKAERLLSNVNVHAIEAIMYGNYPLQHHPTISGKYRNSF